MDLLKIIHMMEMGHLKSKSGYHPFMAPIGSKVGKAAIQEILICLG